MQPGRSAGSRFSSFKTTTPYQSRKLKISSFKTTTLSQALSLSPGLVQAVDSVLSRPPHLPKVEAVKSQFFQDQHTFPKEKKLKMSSFKTTTPSQCRPGEGQAVQALIPRQAA